MSVPFRFEAWAFPGDPGPFSEAAAADGASGVVRADVDAGWLARLLDDLLGAGATLRDLGVDRIVASLGDVGRRFLDPDDPLRREALEELPRSSGLSPEMCRTVLDGMARDWVPERLGELVRRELGADAETAGLVAPGLCFQVVSGSVPGVSTTALIRGLLVRAPTLVKPGLGDVTLPVLFARGLAQHDPDLATGAAVLYWPGGSGSLESLAAARADVVVAYGSDDSVRAMRDRTPVTSRFVAYHHRVSFGAVGREGLDVDRASATAADVANAVAIFDQRGCVSPHAVWVEEGGGVAPVDFAERVADALATLESTLPSGRMEAHESAAVQQIRGEAELRRAAGLGVRLWHGGREPWTVVFEGDEREPGRAAVGRVLRVRSVRDLADVPSRLEPWSANLQTLGVTAAPERMRRLAAAASRVGATRVAPFGEVPFPPAWWRQDGRPVLRDLARWSDVDLP